MTEKRSQRWRRFLSPIASRIPRLSRPWRVVRNLVCIVLGVYLIWLLLGGNPLTKEWAFRREERLAMVGPSEILLERPQSDTELVVGKTPEGYFLVQFFRQSVGSWVTAATRYLPRQADVTLTAADVRTRARFQEESVDLLLLCDDPAVSRGEAELTLAGDGSVNGRRYDFDQTYTVEFLPEGERVLAGRLQPETDSDAGWEGEVERFALAWIYSMEIPVTIRLYDGGGALLLERSIEYVFPRR